MRSKQADLTLSPPEWRALAALAANPWQSSAQLALSAHIDTAWQVSGDAATSTGATDMDAFLNKFEALGWLSTLAQASACLPATLYALSRLGLEACRRAHGPAAKHLARLTDGCLVRADLLRAALPHAQEALQVLLYTAHALALQNTLARFRVFLPRTYKRRQIVLHGALAVNDSVNGVVRAFYLLLDRAEQPVWQWLPQLRYLQRWASARAARADPCAFPALLIVAPSRFRARALLALASFAAVRAHTAPWPSSHGGALTVFASGARDTLLARGLCAAPGSWERALAPGVTPLGDNPWTSRAAPCVAAETFARSVHRIVHAPSTLEPLRIRVEPSAPTANPQPPTQGVEGFEALEALSDMQMRVLAFVCRHPLIAVETVAAFCDPAAKEVDANLRALAARQLVTLASLPVSGASVRAPALPPLWAATERAVRLRALRELARDDVAWARHRHYLADALRRPHHALDVHRFFETLKRHVDQRARASRKLDVPPAQARDGVVPFYAMPDYEAELECGEWYVDASGQPRHFKPDGWGALRAGVSWTRFWLEMDGSRASRAPVSLPVWQAKFERYAAYLASARWLLRMPAPARLLIVTSDATARYCMQDALHACLAAHPAHERALTALRVFVCGREALAHLGPLGAIWFELAPADAVRIDTPAYAFTDIQPLTVDALPRAGTIGERWL